MKKISRIFRRPSEQPASDAHITRFTMLNSQFDLGISIDEADSINDIAQQILTVPNQSEEWRSCLVLLAVTSVYPTAREVNELSTLIRHNQKSESLNLITDSFLKYRSVSLQRTFLPASNVQVDVTSVSRELKTSGIPRTVKHLIQGLEPKPGLHVWSGGAVGPVELMTDGSFYFDPTIWSGSRANRWPYTHLRRLNHQLKNAAVTSKIARIVYGTLILTLQPFIGAISGGHGPKTSVLLAGSDLVLPEVCSEDVSDRLNTWHKHVSSSNLTVLVHDLLPVTNSEFFGQDHVKQFLSYLKSVASADVIVTTTPMAARQISALCRLFGEPEPEIRITPLPVSLDGWQSTDFPSEIKPQFTCVGTLNPRKNHRAVLRAVVDLADRQYPVILNLVGASDSLSSETQQDLLVATRHGVEVRIHANASDSDIKGLVEKSVATIFVSWAEGYGLPVLESLLLGTPVIVSHVEPLSDFIKLGGVVTVNPNDHIALANAMLQMIIDPSTRQELIASIQLDEIPTDLRSWAQLVVERS